MKKGLSRLFLVTIAIAMIVSTIPAYGPYAEQEVPPAEETIEGTTEKTEVVEEERETEQQDTQVTEDDKTEVAEEQRETEQKDTQVIEDEKTEDSSEKVDGDWKDPYYEGKRMLRSVQDKPEKATIKTVSNGAGTGTGAMNLSWKAMPGATGYKVIIGNGYNYEYFTVGNVTSWTTKGKGIFPTKAELDKGLYRFHTDGKGTEFANDPTQLYENTFKAGTTWTLRGQKKYIVRILAVYASGDSPTSDITEAVMPPETLPAKPEKSTIKTTSSGAGTGTGYMDIAWKAVPGAIDYKVVIGNGYNYEYFNTGNVTNWSTKGRGIFPTKAEIDNKQYKFHQDGKGVEFASDPRALYENGYQAGSTFGLRNQKKYIVRILAVYHWGDGTTSDITDATMPVEQMAKPVVTSHRSETDGNVGYLNVSWKPATDAISYKIGLFNGYNYDYIDVGKVTNWSTKGKKLWATTDEVANGRYKLHMDGTGAELPIDPMQTYTAANKANPNVNYSDRLFYYTRVIAVFENNESPVSDAGTVTMPYQSINEVEIGPRGLDEEIGAIDLYWNEVVGAKGYKVWIFNGANYESFDVGNVTEWTSQYQNIWPTDEEVKQGKGALHSDSTGAELTLKPSEVYALNGSNYSDKDMYWSKITAYGENGQTIALNQNETVEIEALPNDEEAQKEMDQINDVLQEYLSRSEETGINFNVEKALQDNLDEEYIEIGELMNEYNKQTGPVEESSMVRAIRIPVWGNWCGPGYGGGKPKDRLDAGCKAHDLCYGKRDYFACSCDRDLQKHIRNNTKYMKAKEKAAAIAIGMWFRNAPCNIFR
ncbi:hypothetical protein HB815_08720 [Listeria booriae]|uniref:hypothetical protein n=1 Tax=Listeria booriae TaxID=1552123 RepID=UPI001623391D|nr:hypothetical protein [Listeria booriae]MBC1211013.1 hypothetical protein [Listeria booriae]